MVSNIKIIKRELNDLTEKDFIANLELLLKKYKLPSDNKVGTHLKAYNIVRDLRSEYVINGRFTYIIYQLALQEYVKDAKEYKLFAEEERVTAETVPKEELGGVPPLVAKDDRGVVPIIVPKEAGTSPTISKEGATTQKEERVASSSPKDDRGATSPQATKDDRVGSLEASSSDHHKKL